MKIKFLLTMAIPLLLAACSKDDNGGGGEQEIRTPVTFIANIQPEAKSRVTVNNGWVGLYDSRIAIMIGGVTKEYTVSEIGEVTSDDPFYWDGQESITVEAWYPYSEGVKPETLVVYADQSIQENYEKSDYLEVLNGGITPKRSTITFTHRTTKLTCNLSSTQGDVQNARVIFHGLEGVNEGNSIKATKKHRALIVPQTIPVGTDFIEVLFEDGGRYVYTLKEELDLKKGFQQPADVSITESGIDVVFAQVISWVVDEETPDGKSPGANPGNGSDGWNNGGSESADGKSPTTDPNEENSGWTGDSEDTNGNSSEANPNNGSNSNWTGSGEDAHGSSPNTNPDHENGGWNSSKENVNGTSPGVTPDGEGTWTDSNSENLNGNDTKPDGWDWSNTP